MTSPANISIGAVIIAALTFIISLAWNDALKSFFANATPFLKRYGPWGYAIGITIIGYIMIKVIAANPVLLQENRESMI